ncbi:type IVB secretion system protein IcmH/DotU [Trinickia soli]|uniref:Type IV secretion protein DotU n=1 Tax=Trinickia soli TaxID=380675 RepID=A0A2N7VXJ7_9BURK|nr:type IVB secretion system protein IcmH/DotU [Trinickia soli]PMS21882.1 type IV secretion protein DotU [Trinickia soli]CAB3649951.1 hypothetical protein LMG24076_00894 [Trinickia soli]
MGDQAMTMPRGEPAAAAALTSRLRRNPLIEAGHPLLALACRVKLNPFDEELESLRSRLGEMVNAFDEAVQRERVDEETRLAARYCICTFVDEVVAATPSGRGGAWARQSLLVLFHAQASGGERFFGILQEFSQDANQNIDALELLYVMLALGMEGRYRPLVGGSAQLQAVRDQLRRRVIAARGAAPAWPGTALGERNIGHRGWRGSTAMLIGAVAASLTAFVCVAQARLHAQAQPVIDMLARVGVASEYAPEPTPSVSTGSLAARFERRLSAELAARRLTLVDDHGKAVLTLGSDGLFASGSATVLSTRVALLKQIGAALRDLDVRIVVTGHTDDEPPSPGRPSNWQLSLARATYVVGLLSAEAGGAERFLAQGRGAEVPVAPNDTPADRARNRRVVITIVANGAGL